MITLLLGETLHHFDLEETACLWFGVGKAGYVCVTQTAIHAAQIGFKSYVLYDRVRFIDPEWKGFKDRFTEKEKVGSIVTACLDSHSCTAGGGVVMDSYLNISHAI